MIEGESATYHSSEHLFNNFTANSNQIFGIFMGLHLQDLHLLLLLH